MKGVVVCPQPRAAEEGSKILARGGNAIDAAVACAFTQAIVTPTMCGVGGFGTMLIYLGKTGEKLFLDFHGRAGSKVTPDMWQDRIIKLSSDTYLLEGHINIIGHTSVSIPGTVKGLSEALTKYGSGKISWREVIEPAIPYAEEGVPVDTLQAAAYTAPATFSGFPTPYETINRTPGSIKIWYKEDGSPYKEGEKRPNKDYARTLRRLIDEGSDSFYTGSIAKEIITDMEENGGFITADDLKNYKTRTYTPLQGSYRGYDVLTNRPPGGGVTLLALLNILEGYPLDKIYPDSLEYIWCLVQALRAVHSDRVQYLGDEEFSDIPVDMLISKERAAYWRKKIDAEESIRVPKGQLQPKHTTHVCTMDEEGNAVSLTHTNGTHGGCATPGLGFLYNNTLLQFYYVPGLPNSIEPGKARETGMCPTMLFKDEGLSMVVGALGGFTIPTAVALSIINVVDHGMTIEEAVSAPRVHCEGGLIELEGRIRADVAEELRQRGNPVSHMPAGYAEGMAYAHGIRVDPTTRKWQAGADPRADGGVAFSHI
ncbi:gamma-glutamyltransferase [Chloroflexota bacterium]